MTRHKYGIYALVSQTSFRAESSGGSGGVGCIFEATFQKAVWQLRYLCMSELKQEITALLTKTERNKCKNTQKVLLYGCHLLFEEYLQEKAPSQFIS